MPPPEQSELRRYKKTASVLLIRVEGMGLDGGNGQTVKEILPGRDDNLAFRNPSAGRPVALVAPPAPRTELMPPETMVGFDGRRVGGKLLEVCRVVSKLPRELLVELALEDRESPLRAMEGMDVAKAQAFAREVARRAGAIRSAEDIQDIHKWRAMVAYFESSYMSVRSLAREPSFPLAGWPGAGPYTAVRRAEGNSFRYQGEDGEWVAGHAAGLGIVEPAAAVEQILSKLPYDVVVDLHETYPGDPLREVLAMGLEKAVAFAGFLMWNFEEVKTLYTWIKALKHFEAHWREGTCFSVNVDEGHAGDWVAKAIDQIYRGSSITDVGRRSLRSPGDTLSEWAEGIKTIFERGGSGKVTAGDVAIFASSPAALKDSRVESVALHGGNVRIVLKEPIFARVIKEGGRTWREDDEHAGKLMNQFPIAAFDLLYDERGNFPNARAWADKSCMVPAKHANINEGLVCMGDLARGNAAHNTGTLNDFLRMLTVWNLDSAFHRGAGYLMQKQTPKPAGSSATYWTSYQVGLKEIQMGYQPLPDVSAAGTAMGTVEEVLD